jgi:hypothetical protein
VVEVDGKTRTLTFGVSGKLADDGLVLYDRETESEWKQSLGRAISGPLAGTDLTVRPASLTTWATFRDAAPEGVVLAPPGGASEAAGDTDAVVFATPDGLYAYRDPGYDFEPVAGSTGESEDGRRLDRLPARRLFAFTWQDDHGPDAFYGLD